MKFLTSFNEAQSLQGKWSDRVMRSVDYKDNTIRMYFTDLTDSGWKELPIKHELCGINFELDEKTHYKEKRLYKKFIFTFTCHADHSMDRTVEVMESLTSAMERLKDDGYNFKLVDLILGDSKKLSKTSYNEKIQIEIFHKKDYVPFEIIFLPEIKKQKAEAAKLKASDKKVIPPTKHKGKLSGANPIKKIK